MAQLKTDEWPDEGERTTTEDQAEDSTPAEQVRSYGRPEPEPSGRDNTPDELRNTTPDDAVD